MWKRFLRRQSNHPYWLVLPAIIVMLITLLYPLIEIIRYSGYVWSFGRPEQYMKYVGLRNFIELFTPGSNFYHSLKLTVIYAVTSIVFQTALGLIIANIFNKKFPGQSVLVSILIIPTILMPVMTAMMWRLYLYPNGVVDYLLSLFGISADWYGSSLALPAVIFIQIWQWTPFFVTSIIAGMRTIPDSLYEAADIDGASAWKKYWSITFPMLRPVLGVAVTIRAMNLIREFDNVYIIYGGGPGTSTEVLGLSIYKTMFKSQQVGMAAALSLVLIVLACICCLFLIKVFRNNDYDA